MADPEVMQPSKRMTRDEKRSLEKVIKGDFEITREEFREIWSKARQRELDAIAQKYADESDLLTEAARSMREAVEKARRDLENALAQIRESGAAPGAARNYGIERVEIRYPTTFVLRAKELEVKAVNDRYSQIQAVAMRSISRQELEALRKLALTGIYSETATDLLNSIPDAQAVLASALSENQPTKEISNNG